MADRRPPEHVTVVIPVRNGLTYLREQLKALAAQDYSGDWDVIVSDNGSSDGLAEYLRSAEVPGGLDVNHVDSSAKAGATYARNVGVQAARGDFLAFTDSDDLVRTDWLRELVDTATTADLVTGTVDVSVINDPEVVEWRPMPAADAGWAVRDWYPAAIGTSMGVWRDVHDAIGGFDETYTHGGDDNDYAWRCQIAGYSLVHSPAAVVDYRLRDNYRDLWKQTYSYGRAAVANYATYRPHGLSGYNHPWLLPFMIVTLAVRNPLLPRSITRLSTGRWIFYTAHEAGKIRESIARRIMCV